MLVHYSSFWWVFVIECSLGYYGYNCEESCDGCLLNVCERENGICTNTSGCKPGRRPGQPWKCNLGMGITLYSFFKHTKKLINFQEMLMW